jgi:chitin synthase
MKTKDEKSAWREKATLCMFIFYSCCGLAFLTYGMNTIVCKQSNQWVFNKLHRAKFADPYVIANGSIYLVNSSHPKQDELIELKDKNLTSLFVKKHASCAKAFGGQVISRYVEGTNLTLKNDDGLSRIGPIHYDWSDIPTNNYIVIENKVYDPTYCSEDYFKEFIETNVGTDATKRIGEFSAEELQCFKDSFYAGEIATKSFGCLFADFMLYISTVAIFGLIITRFVLATFYSWLMEKRVRRGRRDGTDESKTPCILLVTCYSEGRDGLKSTLDSLCLQNYNYDYKLIVVIADGIIKGSDNDKNTPDILLDLIEVDTTFPIDPMDYIALSSGSNRHNRAKVFPGIYKVENKATRVILIVKCGNPSEINTPKPGNRGKRDSQVILMGFFQKILYKDRMSGMDYDLYRKMRHLMPHINPEEFECILMVDADTIVRPDGLRHMVKVFDTDSKVMGICGETKIVNKCESWVTMIQVFEYYISHHLSKSFESVFGGVTCLPGCFCMYRIKSVKSNDGRLECIPILANTFILNAYSVFETTTLHQKNLLLLGEDRYLTTLLLKTFYKRKLIFLPAAKCETLVPARFRVLLSQRRRWINSTIHNLFELVRVDKLCGTFCCSMQFVVVMELMGTLVLPAAIIFTGVLIVSSILYEPAWIPLIMLVGILGLPAVLILLTTREVSYLFWIIVYIASLPIWNFVLPIYAFWHFDDFSWGETRKVQGDGEKSHGESEGTFTASMVPLQHLEEFEANAPTL